MSEKSVELSPLTEALIEPFPSLTDSPLERLRKAEMAVDYPFSAAASARLDAAIAGAEASGRGRSRA